MAKKVDINEPVGGCFLTSTFLPPSPQQMARLADSPHVPNEIDPFLSRPIIIVIVIAHNGQQHFLK